MLMRLRIFLPGAVLLGLLASGFSQEATITPNDALILENIPPIPASVAARAERYTQFRSAAMWS